MCDSEWTEGRTGEQQVDEKNNTMKAQRREGREDYSTVEIESNPKIDRPLSPLRKEAQVSCILDIARVVEFVSGSL